MTTIITINTVDRDHLDEVKAEMLALGAPTIHAVQAPHLGEDVWVALEGSHRIVAAKELGLEVEIEEVEYSDQDMRDFDWNDDVDGETVESLVDSAHQRFDGCAIEF